MGKIVVVVICALALSACIRRPPLTPQERCALDGMALGGVMHSSSRSVGVATSGRYTAVATGSSYSDGVLCVMPMPDQRCEVAGARVSALEKLDFSETPRNAVIGIGYLLWILPGVVMYFVFDAASDTAGREAEALGLRTRMQCR